MTGDAFKELAHQLRLTLGRVELALSLTHDCVIWTDRAGCVNWCNGAFDRLVGKLHVEVVGRKLVDLLPLEVGGRPVPRDEHPATLVFGTRRQLEGTYEWNEEGHRRVLELFAGRRVLQVREEAVFVLRDATERVAAEEKTRALYARLEAANVELEAFSYSVSHDLRTPLRAVDGFSQALLEDYAGALDARGQDYLQRIRAAAQTMGHLIEDMLRLSRVTRAELRREPVDLSEMARAIRGELRSAAPDRDVELVIQDGLVVQGDERLLRLALENLLDNAWKFTRRVPHARIELAGHRTEQEMLLLVRDNGAGFDMAYADQLFGAFQRLHTAQEFPGTGIGLAIVRRIVNRHGGRIWAEAGVGQGATFYVALPREATSTPTLPE